MNEDRCLVCGLLPTHKNYLADLRNKYCRLNTYFQLKELCEDPNASEGIKKMLVKIEKDVIQDNKRFVALLKINPDVWEKNQNEQAEIYRQENTGRV